jgi:hypothetical protein
MRCNVCGQPLQHDGQCVPCKTIASWFPPPSRRSAERLENARALLELADGQPRARVAEAYR